MAQEQPEQQPPQQPPLEEEQSGRPRRTRPSRAAAAAATAGATAAATPTPNAAASTDAASACQGQCKKAAAGGGASADGASGSSSKLDALAGLELRFVESEGVISGRPWTCPLPPAHVEAPAVSFEYVGAAFVDPLSKKKEKRTARLGGLTVTLVAVDGEGQERARFDNGRPWNGGIYYFEKVELPEPGIWSLRLSCRDESAAAAAAADTNKRGKGKGGQPGEDKSGGSKKGRGKGEAVAEAAAAAAAGAATAGAAAVPTVQGQHAHLYVGVGGAAAAAAAATETGVSLGLAVAPRIASDYAGPRGVCRKPAVPRRACDAEELAAVLRAVGQIPGAPDPDAAKDGGGKRKGGSGDSGGAGGGGGGEAQHLDPAYARALLKRMKQLPCEPRERAWLAHEALVAGRTATLFHRNGLHAGLVHFVEGRKRAAMAAGGLGAAGNGEEGEGEN